MITIPLTDVLFWRSCSTTSPDIHFPGLSICLCICLKCSFSRLNNTFFSFYNFRRIRNIISLACNFQCVRCLVCTADSFDSHTGSGGSKRSCKCGGIRNNPDSVNDCCTNIALPDV